MRSNGSRQHNSSSQIPNNEKNRVGEPTSHLRNDQAIYRNQVSTEQTGQNEVPSKKKQQQVENYSNIAKQQSESVSQHRKFESNTFPNYLVQEIPEDVKVLLKSLVSEKTSQLELKLSELQLDLDNTKMQNHSLNSQVKQLENNQVLLWNEFLQLRTCMENEIPRLNSQLMQIPNHYAQTIPNITDDQNRNFYPAIIETGSKNQIGIAYTKNKQNQGCDEQCNNHDQTQADSSIVSSNVNSKLYLNKQDFLESQNMYDSVMVDLNQRCFECQNSIMNEPTFITKCKHSYHKDCLYQLIVNQIDNKQLQLFCGCKDQIQTGWLKLQFPNDSNFTTKLEKLFNQQLVYLQNQLRKDWKVEICQSCSSWIINSEKSINKQPFKCENCAITKSVHQKSQIEYARSPLAGYQVNYKNKTEIFSHEKRLQDPNNPYYENEQPFDQKRLI